jgi:hypothetical protein
MLKNNCWGPFSHEGMLQKPTGTVMAKQSFVFQERDEGPCYMLPQQRLATKHDHVVPGETTRKEHMSVSEELRKHMKQGLDAPLQQIDEITKSQLNKLAKQKFSLTIIILCPRLKSDGSENKKGCSRSSGRQGGLTACKTRGGDVKQDVPKRREEERKR